MKTKRYLWSLYLIIFTIVISIAVQVYFNFKNYQTNKHVLISEVQTSLDNVTDTYYVELAKTKHSPFNENGFHAEWIKSDSINNQLSITVNNKIPKKIKQFNYFLTSDSLSCDSLFQKSEKHQQQFLFIDKRPLKNKDSITLITGLQSIYLSIAEDTLDFNRFNLLLKKELHRKNINIPYVLNHYRNKKLITTIQQNTVSKNTIKTYAKSTYLKKNEQIELLFPNQTKAILKRGLLGILLSLLLATAIIASLFYLLNIIKKQKAIAEIKNDFISNITHEFKTPITTISVAIEALKNFNTLENKEKTNEYLNISNSQLQKLTIMVEKILETSTLDSDKLLLQKEKTNLLPIIEKYIDKHQLLNTLKNVKFHPKKECLNANIDVFHFENAINNLLDNAIKYGGNEIKINLKETVNFIEILIEDNGTIPKNQVHKIFEKFYRIPQGNIHNVKGFGIGLYYAKKIIEKHNGTLELLNSKNTVFQIKLFK